MLLKRKRFKAFVISTFNYLKAEREVFPLLNQFCISRGLSSQARELSDIQQQNQYLRSWL